MSLTADDDCLVFFYFHLTYFTCCPQHFHFSSSPSFLAFVLFFQVGLSTLYYDYYTVPTIIRTSTIVRYQGEKNTWRKYFLPSPELTATALSQRYSKF